MAETIIGAIEEALKDVKKAALKNEQIKNILWERMNFAIQVLRGQTGFNVENLANHLDGVLKQVRGFEDNFLDEEKQ